MEYVWLGLAECKGLNDSAAADESVEASVGSPPMYIKSISSEPCIYYDYECTRNWKCK
jgi:hypothetical protein